jgi:hypothetical protein
VFTAITVYHVLVSGSSGSPRIAAPQAIVKETVLMAEEFDRELDPLD